MKKLLIASAVMLSACSPAPTVVLRVDCGELNDKDLEVTINDKVAGTCPLDTIIRHGETVISARKDNEDASYLYSEVTEKFAENAMKRIKLEFKTVYPEPFFYKKATDISGIDRYLAEFPEGKNAAQLLEKLENIYFENAKNVDGIESYLAKFPSGKYASELHEKLEDVFYSKAKDVEGINKYLEKFPEGKNYAELQEKLENIFYTRATDIKGAETYLEKYPTGKNTTEVKQKLAQFLEQKQIADEKAKAAAKEKSRKEMLAAGFIDNNDGTVTQISTGLQWMRCSIGQRWSGSTCTGENTFFAWQKANAFSHSFAGYDDWRLPDIRELATLVHCSSGGTDRATDVGDGKPRIQNSCGSSKDQVPTINQVVFPNTPKAFFWSSTEGGSSRAWTAFFGESYSSWGTRFTSGSVINGDKSADLPIRLVRDSEQKKLTEEKAARLIAAQKKQAAEQAAQIRAEENKKAEAAHASGLFYFFDDFNSEDSLKNWEFNGDWIVGSTSYMLKDGHLEIHMSKTDVGGRMVKALPKVKKLKVEIKHFMQPGGDYFFPEIGFIKGPHPEANLVVVGYQKSAHGPDNNCGGFNTPVIKTHNANSKIWQCTDSAKSHKSSDFYGRWITTGINFNSETGQIDVDFGNDGSIDMQGVVPEDLRYSIDYIYIGTFGWWTGHLHRIDNIKIYESI